MKLNFGEMGYKILCPKCPKVARFWGKIGIYRYRGGSKDYEYYRKRATLGQLG